MLPCLKSNDLFSVDTSRIQPLGQSFYLELIVLNTVNICSQLEFQGAEILSLSVLLGNIPGQKSTRST